MSFQCSFFCHPSSPYDVIPVRDAQLYERCSLGAIPTSGVSSQCPSNKDNIANLEFKRVIPRELLRQKAGVEFVYNVDLGGFYE